MTRVKLEDRSLKFLKTPELVCKVFVIIVSVNC